ncbi:MAG: rane protein [Bacillales bacterium]|jgi:F0F1-type ATP synthase assembly protein I|nr:rane protein [Bacillales bacterium]
MDKDRDRPFKAMALTTSIVSQLSGCVIIGIFAGRFADQKLNTEPIFLIVGLFLGLAAGVYAVIQTLNRYNK